MLWGIRWGWQGCPSTIVASTVRALIEGQEVRITLRQLGRHKHIGVVNAEVGKDTLVELEAKLPWVTVIHPLSFGVVNVLTGVLVL